jgi:small subunit ribosomal protein S17
MPRREFEGIVISAGKMDKTVKVMVERLAMHPTYKKRIEKRKKYLVHDPENKCKEGDKVIIREGRPFSKLKSFYVAKILGNVKSQNQRQEISPNIEGGKSP